MHSAPALHTPRRRRAQPAPSLGGTTAPRRGSSPMTHDAAGLPVHAPVPAAAFCPPGAKDGTRYTTKLGPILGPISVVSNKCVLKQRITIISWRREWDSNPRYPCEYAAFRVRCLQPLRHLSSPVAVRSCRVAVGHAELTVAGTPPHPHRGRRPNQRMQRRATRSHRLFAAAHATQAGLARLCPGRHRLDRGRDGDCSPPPAQIPARAANAPGSSLGSNVGWPTV